MTTPTDTPPATDADIPICPKCGQPMEVVAGTNVAHCDKCGTSADVPHDTPQPQPEDAVQPDEVLRTGDAQPSTTEPPPATQPDQNAALERATEDALASPGVPGRDEFLTLAQTARMLSMSPLVPKFFRGNPAACFHLAMIGRDLGISPTSAVELIDVMPDKREGNQRQEDVKTGRPMLSPELLNAQVQRLGLGSIVPLYRGIDRCVAVALAPGGSLDRTCIKLGRHFYGLPDDWVDFGVLAPNEDRVALGVAYQGAVEAGTLPSIPTCRCDGIIGESEFTWAMAITAGLVQGAGRDYGTDHVACEPGNHHPYTHTANSKSWVKCDCNQGYITYPERMLWWRASGFCQSDFLPQASIGLYSPEELGASVDMEGRMLDLSTVALPPGYEPGTHGEGGRGKAPDATTEAATAEQLAEVSARIAAMSPEAQTFLKAEWKERNIEPVSHLTAAGYRAANTAMTKAEAMHPATTPAEHPATASPPPAPVAQEATDKAPDPPAAPEPSAGPQAPAGMPPDLAAQFGHLEPVPTNALADSATATVKMMPVKVIDEALKGRGISTEGTPDDRGLRLAEALLNESARQDWDACQIWKASE